MRVCVCFFFIPEELNFVNIAIQNGGGGLQTTEDLSTAHVVGQEKVLRKLRCQVHKKPREVSLFIHLLVFQRRWLHLESGGF